MTEDYKLDLKQVMKEAIEEWSSDDDKKYTKWMLLKELIAPIVSLIVIVVIMIYSVNYYNEMDKNKILDSFNNNNNIYCYNRIIKKNKGWLLSNDNNFFINEKLQAAQYIDGCKTK